jgi:hypothetical protein
MPSARALKTLLMTLSMGHARTNRPNRKTEILKGRNYFFASSAAKWLSTLS